MLSSSISVSEIRSQLAELIENEPLEKVEKERMVVVVNGYGKRSGLVDHLKGLIYRIYNLVKGLFGCSDWNMASDDYFRLTFNDLRKKILHTAPPPTKNARKKVLGEIYQWSEQVAECYLNLLVEATHTSFVSKEEVTTFFHNKKEEILSRLPHEVTIVRV